MKDPRLACRDLCPVRQWVNSGRGDQLKYKKEYQHCAIAYKNAKHPCLSGSGRIDSDIMFVGMCPGETEDREGYVFIGPSGHILDQFYLNPLGLNRDNIYITNAVKCFHEPGVRPKSSVIKNCAQVLRYEIEHSECRYIITLGEVAWRGVFTALYGRVPKGFTFSVGNTYNVTPNDPNLAFPLNRELKILAIYHPAFILYKDRNCIGPQMTKYISNFLRPTNEAENVQYNVLMTYREVEEFFNSLFDTDQDQIEVVIDLETERLDTIRNNKVLCIGIGLGPRKAVIIPIYIYNPLTKQLEFIDVEPAMKQLFSLLKKNLENSKLKIIGHNIKYDALVLYRNLGINIINNIHADTRIMAHLADSEDPEFKKDLKSLVQIRGTLGNYAKDIKEAFNLSDSQTKWYQQVSNEQIWQYCAFDVCGNYEVYLSYKQDLYKLGLKQANAKKYLDDKISKSKNGPFQVCLFYPMVDLYRFFFKVLMHCYRIAIQMELKGIPFSKEYCEELNEELSHKIKLLEIELNELAGKPINWKSPKQLTELFLELNYPVLKRTAKGSPSFDANVLELLAEKGYEIPKKLLEFRKYHKMKSVYAEMYKTYAHKIVENVDGDIFRLACDIDIAGTETGRWATRSPSLHTIPRDNKYRNMVKAPEFWLIMNADYSMAELRVIAGYANCKNMLQAFESGIDFHSLMASQIFNKSMDEVTSEERTFAKRINFGIPYGISPYGLSVMLNRSVEECRDIMNEWFRANWEVREFIEAVKHEYASVEVGDTAKFQNIFGRIRRIQRVPKYEKTKNGREVFNKKYAHNEREAINFYPQSTVADILHVGLVRLDKMLKEAGLEDSCNILLTIHDAVLLEVKEDKVEAVADIVKKALEFPIRFPFVKLSLPVDISWDRVWKKD